MTSGYAHVEGVAGQSKGLDQELAGSSGVQLSPVYSSSVLLLQSQHPLCENSRTTVVHQAHRC